MFSKVHVPKQVVQVLSFAPVTLLLSLRYLCLFLISCRGRYVGGALDKIISTGVIPNATSYTGAIAACSRVGDGDKALEWLKIMSEEGIAPEVD